MNFVTRIAQKRKRRDCASIYNHSLHLFIIMTRPDPDFPDFLQSTEERMEHIAELTLLSFDAMRDALAHLHSLTASLRSPNDNDNDDENEVRPPAERDVRLRLAMSAVVLESTQGRVRTQHRSLLRMLRNAQQPLDHHHPSQPTHNTLPTTRSNPAAVNVLPPHSHARAPDYHDEEEHADAALQRQQQQQQSRRDCDVAAELVASVTTVYRELFSHLAEDLLSVLQPSPSVNDETPPPQQQQQERSVQQSSSKGSRETCVGPPPSQMDKKSG